MLKQCANDTSAYSLVPLIEKKDLSADCVRLLNREWPRSDSARINSLAKSTSASPPMSLLLVEKETNRLVGHARLCRLLRDPLGCWIESVIIDPEFRNKGVGRQLMAAVEKTAIAHGFAKAYLSTKDKQAFYTKCGYQLCNPVVYCGCTRIPSMDKFLEHFDVTTDTNSNTIPRTSVPKPEVLPVARAQPSAIPPPPAPPPTNFLKSAGAAKLKNGAAMKSEFMCKILV